jgi:hypothetical protein
MLVASRLSLADVYVYVSPTGNDSWNGSSAKFTSGANGPLKSLTAARDAARALRAAPPNGEATVRVELLPGQYQLTQALALSAADSGSDKGPTIYEATSPGTVLISGGVALDASRWHPAGDACGVCKSHPQILIYTLPPDVLSQSGSLVQDGPDAYFLGRKEDIPRSEVFWKGKHMELARWPHEGFINVADEDASLPGAGLYTSASIPGWVAAEHELWARGYWKNGWAVSSRKVSSVALGSGHVVLDEPIKPFGVGKKGKFYFFNVLSALNAPGEWYLDAAGGRLFFWPPAPLAANDVQWPLAEHLIVADGSHNLQIRGLSFAYSRGTAVVVKNGQNVDVSSCSIYAVEDWAAEINGSHSGVTGCELQQLGSGGVLVSGGNRNVLAPASNYVKSSNIHDYAQRNRVYHAGVELQGVGNMALGNRISDAPHLAILVSGNDQLVEGNRITRVNTEASDAGAIYIHQDWTARGNVIRGNYLYDLAGTDGREVKGVYLDDQTSGTTVEKNVFWNVQQAVFIGGGSDNTVSGNLFVGSSPGIHLDQRGMNWQKNDTQNTNGTLQKRLRMIPYDSSPQWGARYPQLLTIKSDGFGIPRRNGIYGNTFIWSKPYDIGLVTSDVLRYQRIEQGVSNSQPAWGNVPVAPQFDAMCAILHKQDINMSLCH